MFMQMSIIAGILIILTFIIRSFFYERLPKGTFLVLWIVILLRLLLPISFYTDHSFQGFMDLARDHSAVESQAAKATRDTSLIEMTPELGLPDYLTTNNTVLRSSAIDWSIVISTIHIVGTITIMMYFTRIYWKFRRRLRFALPIKNNDFIAKWKLENRLSRAITILVCDQIKTPLTIGILRPKIYLPKQMNWADTTQIEYILAHEFYHIKRLDVLWKLIAVVALCIHWFNPLVWVMYVLANRDLEITCDAWVVRKFGLTSKREYAFTLIDMAEQKRQFMPLYSGFAKNAAEERIKSIMKGGRSSLAAVLIAILIVPIFALAAFAAPAQDEYENDDQTAVETVLESGLIDEASWAGTVMGINTDPALGYSTGIQALLDVFDYWDQAIVLSTDGVASSSFYHTSFSEMWEVETAAGQRYIITSWRSTNPTYPYAYEIRIKAR